MKASDQAGSVDLSNFMKLWQQFKATVNEDGDDTEEEIKQAFKDYDRDGDGYITKDEMMNVRISLKTVLIKLVLIFKNIAFPNYWLTTNTLLIIFFSKI